MLIEDWQKKFTWVWSLHNKIINWNNILGHVYVLILSFSGRSVKHWWMKCLIVFTFTKSVGEEDLIVLSLCAFLNVLLQENQYRNFCFSISAVHFHSFLVVLVLFFSNICSSFSNRPYHFHFNKHHIRRDNRDSLLAFLFDRFLVH